MAASKLRSVTMSRTWGMFSRMTGSSVSRAAAMAGRAAFLAPLMRTVPTSGLPPRITSLSIEKNPATLTRRWNVGRAYFILRGMSPAVAGPADAAELSGNNPDQQQALIVYLGVGSRECAVDFFSDRSERLGSIFEQQRFELFESEFDSVFLLSFEDAIGCNQQKIARQQFHGAPVVGRSGE